MASEDQRSKSVWIFGAICPQRGAGAGLVVPRCNTAMMQLHLHEIATHVAPGAYALLMMDRAGWHMTASFRYRTTSRSCPGRPKPRSSTRSRIFGSSCAKTGSQTGSSNPTNKSTPCAARRGTNSSINLGQSCQSECGNGRNGSDQLRSVLYYPFGWHRHIKNRL